ncbi:MAG: SusC/RagA family TonB-linked outer membrane protein [Saprospiraceae bacterium]
MSVTIRRLSTFLIFFFILAGLMAQKTVTGFVLDAETGEGLIGANIRVPNTSIGTITDIDGSFSLQVANDVTQLEISYTGYENQIVSLDQGLNLTVRLTVGSTLDEVLVIGYGTVKREDATGSVQTVSSKDFNMGAISSPQELISGKIAGVQVTTNGDPGGGSTIRIRGGSSLSATNDPLVVIDGIPVATDNISGLRNPLNAINPNDIETFTILKDASATAIYGSRASNGVILITTKKGSLRNKMRLDYSGNVSISTRAKSIDVLNADNFRSFVTNKYASGHPALGLLGSENTDWQDVIFQNAIGHDHNLSLSGGVGEIPYRVSLGYTNRDGLLKTDNFSRTTAAINLSPGLLDNYLQINVGLKGMFAKNQFADWGAIGSAINFDPTQPVYDTESPYGGYYTWLGVDGRPNTLAPANPLALLEMRDNHSNVNRYLVNASVDYRMHFLPDLRANLNLGYDYSDGSGTNFVPKNAAFTFSDGGYSGEYSQTKKNSTLEFYLNYVKDLSSNTKLDLMGGYSWQHFYVSNYNFASNVDGSEILSVANTDPREYYLVSLFGRANLTLADNLLITGTLRRDGTSRFSPDNRWGLFPAFAVAYKVLENRDASILSNLKVRLGYGVTGQQDIGSDYYPYLARYLASQENARYQFGDTFITTLRPNGYDANIKWEETATYNAALDYGFLKDRLYGSIEYYYRQTKDLINFIPVPAGTNLTNFINTNVGDLENRGIEFSINAIPVQTENSSWDIGFNVTANKNKITRLTATDDPNYPGVYTGGISGGVGNTIQIHSVGYPANSFYVYEQVYDESGVPIEGLYVDRNGDGQVTPDDRYHLQKPAPDFFLGLTTAYRIKNFDISLAARANVGNYVYNNVASNLVNYSKVYHSTNYLTNLLGDYGLYDFNDPRYFSDRYIENASFLKVDHITAGYQFDEALGLRGIRVYATIQNPLIISNYTGIDPEIANGIDNNFYPRPVNYLLGLNVNF